MIKLSEVNARMHALALSFIALALATPPRPVHAQPAPLPAVATMQATFVNNHRESLAAKVWVDGVLVMLGELTPGERRTFELPPAVTEGARYYLLGDCDDGERIRSDPLRASAERHAHFVVARTAQQSYVRYTDAVEASRPR